MLAYRTVWSLVFFGLVLGLQGRLHMLWRAVANPASRKVIAAAAIFISINWFLFIWSIHAGRATEASMGYYIFPLVAVLIGRVVLGEQLSRTQWVAITLAASGVLSLTVGLHIVPWISLVLASTFGLYGLIKKRLDLGPVVSVSAEVLLLCPLGLGWLVYLHSSGQGGAFGQDLTQSLLLMAAGPITAMPLILFSYGARRLTLSTVGIVQYINPTLQFLVAVLIFGEPFTHGPPVRLCPDLDRARCLFQQRLHSGQGAAQDGDGVGSRSRGLHEPEQRRICKTLIDHVVEKSRQRGPIVVHAQKNDRLAMQAKLPPGEHLEKLVQRPGATRQNDDGIGVHHHHLFCARAWFR